MYKKLLIFFILLPGISHGIGAEKRKESSDRETDKFSYKNARLEDPQEFLFQSARLGDAQGVRQALRQGALVNAPDAHNDSLTAGHYAARGGYVNVLEVLLEYRADMYARDAHGRTLFHTGAVNNRVEVLKWLYELERNGGLEYKDEGLEFENDSHYETYEIHAQKDFDSIFDQDKQSKVDTYSFMHMCDDKGQTPFVAACGSGCLDSAKWLVGYSWLDSLPHAARSAAKGGFLDVLEWLSTYNPISSIEALVGAIAVENLQTLEWLNKRINFVTYRGRYGTITHLAAHMNAVVVLEWLFNRGIHLYDRRNTATLTPFEHAASVGNTRVLEWFFRHGFSCFITENQIGAMKPCPRTVNSLLWLLEHGLSFHLLTKDHLTFFKEHYSCIYALLIGDRAEAELIANELTNETEIKEFHHAFLLMVALGYSNSVEKVLTNSKEKITVKLLRFGLESALATNNRHLFDILYRELRSRIGRENGLTAEEFRAALQDLLYVAALRDSQAIIHYIVERGIAYEELLPENIMSAAEQIEHFLASYPTRTARERLTRIQNEFIHAASLPRPREVHNEESGISEYFLSAELPEWNWLPRELWPLIFAFALRRIQAS